MIIEGTTEFVTFKDQDDHLWTFDVGWMLSTWRCTYGEGCPGAFGQGNTGCCDIGFSFESAERAGIEANIAKLTPETWDNHEKWATKRWWYKRDDGDDDYNSKVVIDGKRVDPDTPGATCVFNNVKSGTGCAFHHAALQAGESPLDWKPDVCWMVPMSVEHEDEETFVGPMKNLHWGQEEWEPLHWWCIESHGNTVHDAYADHDGGYTFRYLKDEITKVAGANIYGQLERYCLSIAASVQANPITAALAPLMGQSNKLVVGYPNAPVAVAIRNAKGKL